MDREVKDRFSESQLMKDRSKRTSIKPEEPLKKISFQEQIAKARKVAITSVMSDQGMHFNDMRNFAQGIEHDSLMIDKRQNRYYWNSQIENGKVVQGDVIDFVQRFYNKTFTEAVEYLTLEQSERFERVEEQKSKPKEPFHYYFQHHHNFRQAHDYLVNERGLSSILVNALHEKGFIQEDKYHQTIFVWSDMGKATGASVIGANQDFERFGKHIRFKGIARNSTSNFGFNITLGTPDKLYVFESPIDLLSYWTLNPQLENCMLTEMEGLKEQSVYRFVEQMHISKGALPTEGIYLGVDNDPAGQRFFDNLSKLSYIERNSGKEIQFKNLIPHDLDIPQSNLSTYQKVAKQYQVDWRAIAAVHKSLTNYSEEGQVANHWNREDHFTGNEYDLQVESEKVAQVLANNEQGSGQYDFSKLFPAEDPVNALALRNLRKKVEHYYDNYQNRGYRPTEQWFKDWNDVLQYKNFRQEEKALLKAVYQRNDKEKLSIWKAPQKANYQAFVTNEKEDTEPFFEADSPREASRLIKSYGFQAVDKEDRRKYQMKSSQKTTVNELSR